MNYKDYISTFEKYSERDVREVNFQNELVKPLLRSVFPHLYVEDVSEYSNSLGVHDFSQYAGLTVDNKNSQPDLVICDNWMADNRNKNIDYKAVVEVKSPYLGSAIFHKSYDKLYSESIKTKMQDLLRPGKVKKLIFTDTLKWEFYYIDPNKPVKTIQLYVMEKNKYKDRDWKWKNEDAYKELVEFLQEFI